MLLGGTLINVLAVGLGSAVGILAGNRIPEKINKSVFQALGLFTLILGISMALEGQLLLVIVFSLIIGTILGEVLSLEQRIDKLSNVLMKLFRLSNPKFSEGMIISFLLYCMGSMTIVGAIDEGLGNGIEILLTKSVMDGFSSIALASVFGLGVTLSVVPMLIFQGGITLVAYVLGDFIAQEVITELSAVGGIILVGLGINILELKRIKVMNMLPSLVVVVLFAWLWQAYLSNY